MHNIRRPLAILLATVCGIAICSCRSANEPAGHAVTMAPPSAFNKAPTTSPTTAPTTAPTTVPSRIFRSVETEHLHNAHIVTDKVVSGAQPEGEESFKTLQAMGIKTIISVDGAKPDIELATKYGMTYVHLPIGYDGVTPERGRQIAKAISEKRGPIYVHCHHGKHRSAAAVAVACVYNGSLDPTDAEAVLKTFGTGANYKGLWSAARTARPVDAGELAALQVEFVPVSKIGDFAEHMVKVDEHWEHVKLIKSAGWKTPKDHPDLDPAHEVLQVQEHYTESARLESTAARPEAFRTALSKSEGEVKALHAILASPTPNPPAADAAFKVVAASCVSCHKAYRD